jgi:hypothetical protein
MAAATSVCKAYDGQFERAEKQEAQRVLKL